MSYKDLYNYRVLDKFWSDEEKERYKTNLRKRYYKIIREWNSELNTEWIVRNYLATKMVMSATLMINSMQYAKESNLRITEPYLGYYALLTVCRAILYTIPEEKWNEGELIKTNHSKSINVAINTIKQINKELGEEISEAILLSKDFREFYSYRFPASGKFNEAEINNLDNIIDRCTIMCEIAQYNSAQLQACIEKKLELQNVAIKEDMIEEGYLYKGEKVTIFDEEDWYRLIYICKGKYATSIFETLREGMVEDFFGAWYPDGGELEGGQFNPDNDLQVIFDLP